MSRRRVRWPRRPPSKRGPLDARCCRCRRAVTAHQSGPHRHIARDEAPHALAGSPPANAPWDVDAAGQTVRDPIGPAVTIHRPPHARAICRAPFFDERASVRPLRARKARQPPADTRLHQGRRDRSCARLAPRAGACRDRSAAPSPVSEIFSSSAAPSAMFNPIPITTQGGTGKTPPAARSGTPPSLRSPCSRSFGHSGHLSPAPATPSSPQRPQGARTPQWTRLSAPRSRGTSRKVQLSEQADRPARGGEPRNGHAAHGPAV